MKKTPTRATKGIAWNFLYKLSEFGLFNLYSIIVVRHFGPELAGPFTVYLSVFNTLAIVSAFAVDGVLLRYSELVKRGSSIDLPGYVEGDMRSMLRPLAEFRMTVCLVIAVLAVLLLGVVPMYVPAAASMVGSLHALAIPLAVSLLFQGVIAFCASALIGLLETKALMIGSIIARSILVLGATALFASNGLTIETAVAVHLASLVLGAGILVVALLKLTRRDSPALASRFAWLRGRKAFAGFFASGVIAYGMTTWGTDILSMILSRQPDVIMLGAIYGEFSTEVSFYHSATTILLVAEYLFLFGFGGTLVALLSGLSHQDASHPEFTSRRYASLLAARKKVADFQAAATVPFFTFVGVFAGPIIHSVFGTEFLPATMLVQVGVVISALTVSLLGGGMSVTSLVSIGEQKAVFRIRLACGVVNIPLNLLLISQFGALGAVLGTQLCNTAACALEAYLATKKIGQAIDFSGVISVYAVSIAASAIAYLATDAAGTASLGPVIHTIAAGTIAAALTLLAYHALKVRIAQDTLQRIYGILHLRVPTLTERLSG